MSIRRVVAGLVFVSCAVLGSSQNTAAQSLGTFRWQLQPYCNVLTLNVTQNGANFTLNGLDDLCATSPSRAAVVGLAYPRTDGTIGIGVTVVLDPGGVPVHISASIAVPTVSGSWRDSAGNSGSFVFNPSIAPGSPRPFPKPVFAAGLSSGNVPITDVGTPTAPSDAANKAYVDQAAANAPREGWLSVDSNTSVFAMSANLAGTTVVRPPGRPIGYYCISFPPGSGFSGNAAVGSIQQSFQGNGAVSFITVTRSYSHACFDIGAFLAVQTYDAAGAPADRPFALLVPR